MTVVMLLLIFLLMLLFLWIGFAKVHNEIDVEKMKKCKTCKELRKYKNEAGSFVWCPQGIYDTDKNCDKYNPITNADRIRNMSDEELAEWICRQNNGYDYVKQLSWLQQEAEQEE